MAIIVSSSSTKQFKPVPPGMYLARCYRMIEMGTQTDQYGSKQKIMLQFEIHAEDDDGIPLVMDTGAPMSISKKYTATMFEKGTLSKDLESWRGSSFTADEREKFDIERVLGAWAMISIAKKKTESGDEITLIANINPVPAAVKKVGLPAGFNELQSLNLDKPNMSILETLSPKLQEKILSSPEWKDIKLPKKSSPATDFDAMEDFNDDPF